MALRINNQYTFYHIGKTGGRSIRKLLKAISKTEEVGSHPGINGAHCSPLDVSDHIYENAFCVVRHPLGLYKSNYRYLRVEKQGDYVSHWINGFHKSVSFEEFVNKILKIRPRGLATSTYCQFIPFCKHVLKQENLENELARLLVNWGFKKIPLIERQNVSDKSINTNLSKKTLDRLLEAEQGIIKYLNYG
jgi:hypothetical protein